MLAVDPPALTRYPSSDPNIDSFTVCSKTGGARFLHTSPEASMKRLLAAGYPDIYSICPVYRDGETGHRHRNEFTMIEWYRLGFDLNAITADATTLIARCLEQPGLISDVVMLDYRDAFTSLADVDVLTASVDDLARCAGADAELRHAIGTDRDAWLDLLLVTTVVPRFEPGRITVLRHFPASMAMLARRCPADPRFADRFEVFMEGLELANGYVELTDAEEQRRRIDAELVLRRAAGRAVPARDEHLLSALDAGLPDCAGVALGVERLQMILDRTDDIHDVITFADDDSDA